jgi:hypothetical protein
MGYSGIHGKDKARVMRRQARLNIYGELVVK